MPAYSRSGVEVSEDQEGGTSVEILELLRLNTLATYIYYMVVKE